MRIDDETVSGSSTVFGECNEPGTEGPPCVCSSDGCTVDMSGSDGAFRLELATGSLDGTFAYTPVNVSTPSTLSVHLTRQ